MRDEVVHSIESPKKGRLSTSGRSDESGNVTGVDWKGDVFKSANRPVVEIESPDLHLGVMI
jgi:hypothetical protein